MKENFNSINNVNETQNLNKEKRDKLIEELKDFYKDNAREYVINQINLLLEKNPKVLETILDSTKDLREVSNKLIARAEKAIIDNNIDAVQDPSGPGYISREGVKKGKLNAPDPFSNIGEYTKFVNKEQNKTGYEGLNPKQCKALLSANLDILNANMYHNDAEFTQFELITSYGIEIENSEYHSQDTFDKIIDTVDSIATPIHRQLTFLKARFDGKIAQMKEAPKFTSDKIEDVHEDIQNAIKNIWKETQDKIKSFLAKKEENSEEK